VGTLVVIRYQDQGTAEHARHAVADLQDATIHAEQVAAISRDLEGRYHVHTSHGGFPTATGAIWGGFWGFLFGTLFLIPFAGWATGAGVGAWLGHVKEKTVDEAFETRVRDHLQPGTSALFMVVGDATPDEAIAAVQGYGGTVMKTTVSEEHVMPLQYGPEVPAPKGGPS
jgi:uncharacterized membrane protein